MKETEYTAVIVNGGSLGRRVKRIAESRERSILLVETNEDSRKRNAYAKTMFHTVGSAVQRREYHSSYAIEALEGTLEWKTMQAHIKKGILHYMKDEKQENQNISPLGNNYKNDCTIIVERKIEDPHPNLDNLYLSLLSMDVLPKKWVISGDTPRSLESASILSDLGCIVYLVLPGEKLLPGLEENLQRSLKDSFLSKNILMFFSSLLHVEHLEDGRYNVCITDAKKEEKRYKEIDYVLQEEKYSFVEDPEHSLVKVSNIEENRDLAEIDMLRYVFKEESPIDTSFSSLPRFIYTNPSIASIGKTEEKEGFE